MGRDHRVKGGTGKAEDAKVQDAGTSPKQGRPRLSAAYWVGSVLSERGKRTSTEAIDSLCYFWVADDLHKSVM